MLKYSNSWGHLIMSIALLASGLCLILISGDINIKATGVGLITSVSSLWLVTYAAGSIQSKQQAQQGETPHAPTS